jgi:hypothetical protein
LCGLVDDESSNNKIHGITPYIAPDVNKSESLANLNKSQLLADLNKSESFTDLNKSESLANSTKSESFADLTKSESLANLNEPVLLPDLNKSELLADLNEPFEALVYLLNKSMDIQPNDEMELNEHVTLQNDAIILHTPPLSPPRQ